MTSTTHASSAAATSPTSQAYVTSFDSGWELRPKVSLFAQIAGRPDGQQVRLPHDAVISLPRSPENAAEQAYFPGGVFEYSKTFFVPEHWEGKRVGIEFDGVYRDAVVFINDAAVAQRPYGYSAFTVEFAPYLHFGRENTVRVEARSCQDSRWYTGAGIYRHTRLFVTDPVHIAPNGVRITTPDIDDERAVTEVAVDVRNLSAYVSTTDLEVALLDPSGRVVAQGLVPVTTVPQETETARLRLYVRDPLLWRTYTPYLYTARVSLRGSSTHEEQAIPFGIRSLRLDPRHGLRINGEVVKLRGACIHSDNGILGAAAFARADERRIEQLKEAGFNAIRSAHNPLSSTVLAACDRLGMLVMDEAFDVWTELKSPQDYTLRFTEWWERDITAMVARDFNHPSVIFYSVGNEIFETGDPLGSRLGRRIAEKLRELDPTRFITGGGNGLVSTLRDLAAALREIDEAVQDRPEDINALMAEAGELQENWYSTDLVTARTAESFGVLDVAGMNYSESRYELDKTRFPNRIIVSTETFPTKIAANWKRIEKSPRLLGDFTWTGYDYLGEVGIGRVIYPDEYAGFEGPYPWISAWCGDLDLIGFRRPQSYYRELAYGRRSEPYIAVERPELYGRESKRGPWSWTEAISSWSWDVMEETPIRVEVYADADEVELLLEGEPLGRVSVGERMALVADFDTKYKRGILTAIAYRGGKESGRTTLASTSGSTVLALTPDRREIRDSDGDLVFLTVELTDENGLVETSADRPVTVAVQGAGVLQAFGSARPRTEERYDADVHTTYDGRALLVVRPTGEGKIVVTATAEGLEPAHAWVNVIAASRDQSPN
ncbi:glycoside hydrolase [Microbacterium sp. Root166]|uniref:glycoside hydrolase family 2 protein n=1 Tax=Microbacterium sp. Root166 TaxID=1736478 RepID=UPI0006FE3AA3|nr:glycoside hydrolase family 2 TIM barrel-domain containing protein [Microbacterium sp. Root166]KQZ86100.1 glycoside hydrolase [Microbacterium sp. Root166]